MLMSICIMFFVIITEISSTLFSICVCGAHLSPDLRMFTLALTPGQLSLLEGESTCSNSLELKLSYYMYQ